MRFRLYPTPAQAAVLARHCGDARWVYNQQVEQWQARVWAGYAAAGRWLTRTRAELGWLAAGSATVQQEVLRDFRQAVANYRAGTHRRPTWRRKGCHEGFRVVGAQARRVQKLSRKWARVLVPKVGWVRFRRTRAIPDAASYRVTLDRAGRWHIAFVAIPDPVPAPGTGEVVGVDRGVAAPVATSTGRITGPGGLSPGEQQRLVRLQRHLARAHRGSRRRQRVRTRIARLRAREADRRKHWVETTSTDMARQFDLIGIEDLNIAALTRSARGTTDSPGQGVRAKAGLNRGILSSGWGLLATRLEHKASGRVVRVDPAYTSQRCSACQRVDPKARESQAVFACRGCGHTVHADVNAAENVAHTAIRAVGRTVPARGALQPPGGATNRELQLATPNAGEILGLWAEEDVNW